MSKYIIFIKPYWGNGGTEKSISYIIKKIKSINTNVKFILITHLSSSNSTNQLNLFDSIKTYKYKSIFGIFQVICKMRFSNLYNRQNTTLISNQYFTNILCGFYLRLFFFNIYSISIDRLSFQEINSRLIKILMRFNLIPLAYSKFDESWAISVGLKDEVKLITKRNVELVLNPSSNYIKHKSKRKSSNQEKNTFNLLFVSRFEKVKRPEVCLNSFEELLKISENKKYKLTMIGDGNMKNYIEGKSLEIMNIYSERAKIELINFQKDISNFYLNADIFLHTAEYEGLGNVIIEAALYGLPIVSTNYKYGIETINQYASINKVNCYASALEIAKEINFCCDNLSALTNLQKQNYMNIKEAFSGKEINQKIFNMIR